MSESEKCEVVKIKRKGDSHTLQIKRKDSLKKLNLHARRERKVKLKYYSIIR